MSRLAIRAAGDSHRGAVRAANEDALIVDGKLGLYVVLDGMGGANAGDVASSSARDVIHEFVRARRGALAARPLLEAALNAASAAVHGEAQRRRDRHGMGTTVVACLIDGRRATIAHVGDSRAYLRRDGRLHRLTQDHTVVAELVARGTAAMPASITMVVTLSPPPPRSAASIRSRTTSCGASVAAVTWWMASAAA